MGMSVGMRGQSSGRGFTEFERFELGGRWRMLAASSDEIASMNKKKNDITLFLSARNSSCLILSAAASIRSRAGVIIF